MKQLVLTSFVLLLLACSSNQITYGPENQLKSSAPLYGKWEVVQANIIPYEHISFCEKLGIGAIFEFQKDSVLNVYPKTGKKVCNRDQVYYIWKGDIRITEIDMVFLYDIELLTKDSLKISINRVPHYFNTIEHPEGVNVEQLKKEGVKLTLVKQ